MNYAWPVKHSLLSAIALGTSYGIFLRFVIARLALSAGATLVMTGGFLIMGSMAVGYVTVSSAEKLQSRAIWQWILVPWLPMLLTTGLTALFLLEGMICIVFALPLILLCASIGGVAGGISARRIREKAFVVSTCVALLPFLVAPLETQLRAPVQHRRVVTQILIHAPAARVWSQIERVPRITSTELPTSWTQRIGFPRPLEATLSCEGVGGVRHATFEGGLLFIETVTEWRPCHSLGFTIHADTANIPATTLDEHVTIGGRYFDVLDGRYEIEPQSGGDVILHLSSQERLSTDFNVYAGLWSDAVMRNIQEDILHVIKRRAEHL